jgi:DME family drug/metabolite transporter
MSRLLVAGLLFGAGAPIGGLLSRTAGLPSLAVATYRLMLGGALIVIYLMCTDRRLPRGRAAWIRIVIMAALAALCQACYFAAAGLSTVTQAVLITIGAAPVLVLVAERMTGRRAGQRRLIGAISLALPGLALLVGLPDGMFQLAGAGLALVAAGAFAGMTLVSARPVSGVDELGAAGFGFLIGGALLAAVTGPGLRFQLNTEPLILLALLGSMPTGLAYGLYFQGVRRVGAGTGAVLALLEPLSGAVLAAVLLGESLGPTGIAGGIMLAVAMIVATRSPHRVTTRLLRHDVSLPTPVKSNPQE